MKKYYFALSVLGRDRVGIVAKVTGLLARSGVNIDDSSMARLKNEFSMILLLSSPRPIGDLLRLSLAKLLPGLEFSIRGLASAEVMAVSVPSRVFSVKIYGADRIGIVAEATRILASLNVNIIDMRTRLIKSPRRPDVYILLLDAVPPARLARKALEKKLKRAAEHLGVVAEISEYEPAEL
jgi:glycine cleavage system transcriptional repressor